MQPDQLSQDLGNGLVLRQAAQDDVAALVAFHQQVQGEGQWARQLADGSHPTTRWSDFTLVEDTRAGQIASSMCLIPQVWAYGGVAFGAARVEMVSTHPDYRMLGLARAQFEQIHRWSEARGHLLQALVGRPWLYRKFGYTMALQYWGGRQFALHGIPNLAQGAGEPYPLRPATEGDLPFVTQLYQGWREKYLVTCQWDQDQWHYQIFRRDELPRLQLRIIENAEGQPAGYLLHAPGLDESFLPVFHLQLAPGCSWLRASPGVMRYLAAAGQAYAAQEGTHLAGIYLGLGNAHPMYLTLGDYLPRATPQAPFAWYLRVPDLARFIRQIAPVLEQRLNNSVACDYNGALKLCFYSKEGGLALSFDNGRLLAAENRPVGRDETHACLPHELFLQLLFGYKSVDELEAVSKEVWLRGTDRLLLQALFPQQDSAVFSIC